MNELDLIDILIVFMLCLLAFIMSRSYFDSDLRVTLLLIIAFITIMVFIGMLDEYFYTIAILLLAVLVYSIMRKN